jgi:hypothetical protein
MQTSLEKLKIKREKMLGLQFHHLKIFLELNTLVEQCKN